MNLGFSPCGLFPRVTQNNASMMPIVLTAVPRKYLGKEPKQEDPHKD
jgi:hypothetical protein